MELPVQEDSRFQILTSRMIAWVSKGLKSPRGPTTAVKFYVEPQTTDPDWDYPFAAVTIHDFSQALPSVHDGT